MLVWYVGLRLVSQVMDSGSKDPSSLAWQYEPYISLVGT
jgi:hypothetical protein